MAYLVWACRKYGDMWIDEDFMAWDDDENLICPNCETNEFLCQFEEEKDENF
jgi:hypothetical protein